MLQALKVDISDDRETINVEWYDNVMYSPYTYFVLFYEIQLFLSTGIIHIFEIAAVNWQRYYCDYCDLNGSMFIKIVR